MSIFLRYCIYKKWYKCVLSPPKCNCSQKLLLDLFLILDNGLVAHCVLDATVETRGLGRRPSPVGYGVAEPPYLEKFITA